MSRLGHQVTAWSLLLKLLQRQSFCQNQEQAFQGHERFTSAFSNSECLPSSPVGLALWWHPEKRLWEGCTPPRGLSALANWRPLNPTRLKCWATHQTLQAPKWSLRSERLPYFKLDVKSVVLFFSLSSPMKQESQSVTPECFTWQWFSPQGWCLAQWFSILTAN